MKKDKTKGSRRRKIVMRLTWERSHRLQGDLKLGQKGHKVGQKGENLTKTSEIKVFFLLLPLYFNLSFLPIILNSIIAEFDNLLISCYSSSLLLSIIASVQVISFGQNHFIVVLVKIFYFSLLFLAFFSVSFLFFRVIFYCGFC